MVREAWLAGVLVSSMAVLTPAAAASPAQDLGACHFDTSMAQFRGDPAEQAACLLRPPLPWGKVSVNPAVLPEAFAKRLGMTTPPRASLALLTRLGTERQTGLPADQLPMPDMRNWAGGDLDAPLSQTTPTTASGPLSAALSARYFVIHDTSWPWLGTRDFPAEDDTGVNDLKKYSGRNGTAHVFINRLGETFTAHGFSEPWRATKLELAQGAAVKGLFLHIELVQPRRQHPAGPAGNDIWAPDPGFTSAQYWQLAWLYVVASARGGHWLIPALHGAIDEGLVGAHDDPQNFDVQRFLNAVTTLQTAWLEALALSPG